MPLSQLAKMEEFLFRVKQLKKDPKTYRVYSYSTRTAGKITLEAFGNRVYFYSVPSPLNLRFNEPENDPIEVTRPTGINQDFYRLHLEWMATGTDNPIYFVVGFDIDFVDIPAYSDTTVPLLIWGQAMAVDTYTWGPFYIPGREKLLFQAESDILCTCDLLSSPDDVVYKIHQSPAFGPSAAWSSFSYEVHNLFYKLRFNKTVPGTPQTRLNISLMVR